MYDKAMGRIVMKLSDYILEFNGLLEILKDTDSNPTDADRYEQFLAGLHPTRYASFTQNIIASKTKMSVNELQDGVLRIENQLTANGEPDIDPSVALAATTALGKRPADDRQITQLRAPRIEGAGGPPSQSTPCQNCGTEGHHHTACPAAPAQCTFCNHRGHLEPFCLHKKRAMNQLARGGKGAGKGGRGGGRGGRGGRGGGNRGNNKKNRQRKPNKGGASKSSGAQQGDNEPSAETARVARDSPRVQFEEWPDELPPRT